MDCSCGVTSTRSLPVRGYNFLMRIVGVGPVSGSIPVRGKNLGLSGAGIMNQPRGRRIVRDLVVLGAIALVIVVASLGRGLRPHTAAMLVGKKFPEIQADGWINGKAPKIESLKGKVLVIEAWATRCGPCRALAPEMVKLQKKYQDKDVVFIGMTDENGPLVPTIEGYLKQTGIGWLNAYGAYATIAKLGAEFIPYVWVVDANGTVAWTTESGGEIEDGIKLALDQRQKMVAAAQ